MKPAKISAQFRVESCDGQALTRLTAADFTVAEDGVALDPNESQHLITAQGESFQINSVLLLDLSGSILRSGSLPGLQQAAGKYLDAVLSQPGTAVAIWTFDGRVQPQVVTDFSSDPTVLHAGLDSLGVTKCSSDADCATENGANTCAAFRCVDDSTNLYGAVINALGGLSAAPSTATFHNDALVVFTDGSDEAGRVTFAQAQMAVAGSDSHVFTVGLGTHVDSDSLRALGKDGYFPATDTSHLASAFDAVAGSVEALANRDYQLVYCSPKRAGRHSVSITAHRLEQAVILSGRLDGEFDATGFSSGCSL